MIGLNMVSIKFIQAFPDCMERFPAWLRTVIAARREPEVLNRLSSLRAAFIDSHRQDKLDDIGRFIEARLQTPQASLPMPLGTVQRKLLDNADGNLLSTLLTSSDVQKHDCADCWNTGRPKC